MILKCGAALSWGVAGGLISRFVRRYNKCNKTNNRYNFRVSTTNIYDDKVNTVKRCWLSKRLPSYKG